MGVFNRLLRTGRLLAAPSEAASLGSGGLLVHDERRPVYSEQAFRYFLSLERARSERSNRTFLLLLVDLKTEPGGVLEIDAAAAKRLFDALWLCLRDTDFVGWYRAGRAAGAVLTQYAVPADTDVSGAVVQRVRAGLHDHLPDGIANRIQVRVYELPPSVRTRS